MTIGIKKMHKRYNKGFTLIELLVVVAIIGLLSSIVLASLNSARNKAKDAAIKEGVFQLVNLLALEYNDTGSYCNLQYGWINSVGDTCDTYTTETKVWDGNYAPQARSICNNIYKNAADYWSDRPGAQHIFNQTFTTAGVPDCDKAYSIMVSLNNGKWYCSGSSGAKGEYDYYGDIPIWFHGIGGSSNPGCYGNP